MTKLLYLENNEQLTCSAHVLAVMSTDDGRITLVLDQTVFYPQGGGQPCDTGFINTADGKFVVEQVRFVDGQVQHTGHFEQGSIDVGQVVECVVDCERRLLNSRIHSAGHVIDVAVDQLGFTWQLGKGYHFPQGPYVEYSGVAPEDRDALARAIEDACHALIAQKLSVSFIFAEKKDLPTLCAHVPDYLPEDKPVRVVKFGASGTPCGGTHVVNLGDIGTITIRKIKVSGNIIRISYAV